MIGEFEYLILAASMRLDDKAYGASIAQEIEAATSKRCSLGALYTTLDRLESKGFIKTRMSDPTPERGGRAKRMVKLTPTGKKAAAEFYAVITTATKGLAWA